MKTTWTSLILAALGAAFVGCQSGGSGNAEATVAPLGADEPVDAFASEDRSIAPQDLVLISIVGEGGLQTEFRVSATGSIQFPYLGLVDIAGLTPDEVKAKLETELSKEYFQNPEVIVTVRDFSPQYVRVFGAVNRPGLYPIGGEKKLDILDAIALASGTAITAKNEVIYTREGVRRKISLKDLEKPENRIWVQPGDIIQVEQSIW